MYHYSTEGTCSRAIHIDMEGDTIKQVSFDAGCDGNLIGISKLVEGMDIHDVIQRTAGIDCKNGTSCPDQLSRALRQILAERED